MKTASQKQLGKYMTAELIHANGGKPKFWILDRRGGVLGEVAWYSSWKQFTFTPHEALFSHDCLAEISKFLSGLNQGIDSSSVPKDNAEVIENAG